MNPLILIPVVVSSAIIALCTFFFGTALLMKLFGQERIERYFKMRTQGPFVPTPEDRRAG